MQNPMDNVSFAVTMAIAGAGGTVFVMWASSIIVRILMKIFPPEEELAARAAQRRDNQK